MKKTIILIVAGLICTSATAAQDINSDHAKKTLEIYTRIIGIESSKNLGNVPEVAGYLASELISAGFPEGDVEVVFLARQHH